MDSSYHADQSISDRIARRNSSDEWFMIDSTMSSESHHIAGSVLGDPFRGHARHRRRRFDPQERAEIAAVRKVGACTNCRSRKVKCIHAVNESYPSSVDTVRSGQVSPGIEFSDIPSLSNSISVISGGSKGMQDSVMLERFIGGEGNSVRWLDSVEGKSGYDSTDVSKDALKDLISDKGSTLDQFALPYPPTLDFNALQEDIVVHPARIPVSPGENLPWDMHTGLHATQPRRTQGSGGVERRRQPRNGGQRRSNTGRPRRAEDPRLLEAVRQTTQALSDMSVNLPQQFGQSAGCVPSSDDTWGESSENTILPPPTSNYGTQIAGHTPAAGNYQPNSGHLQSYPGETTMYPPWQCLDTLGASQDMVIAPVSTYYQTQHLVQPYGQGLPQGWAGSDTPQINLGSDSSHVSSTAVNQSILTDAIQNELVAGSPSPGFNASSFGQGLPFRGIVPATENISRSFDFGAPMTPSRSFSQQRSSYLPQSSFSSYSTPEVPSPSNPRPASIAEGVPSSFDSNYLTPMRNSRSYSGRRSSYLPQNNVSSPNTPDGMSRQPSLAGESASSRDGTFLMSPQPSRFNPRPGLDSSTPPSSSLLSRAHGQTSRMTDTTSYPPGLPVEFEYAHGGFGKEPLESYEQLTPEEIDELLRI